MDNKLLENIENNKNEDYRKIRKFCLVSIISAIIGFFLLISIFILPPIIVVILGITGFRLNIEQNSSLFIFLWIIILLSFVTSFTVGVISFVIIRKKKIKIKENNYLIISILVSLFSLLSFFAGKYVFSIMDIINEENSKAELAKESMQKIKKAITVYADKNQGRLPDANRWCDSLMEYDKDLTKETFKIIASDQFECGIAFNKNLSGLKLLDIPGNVVLLFEAKGRWNLTGSNDLLSMTNKDRRWIISILFADGSLGKYFFNQKVTGCYSNDYVYYPLHWKP